jgi:hypothetical protein
MTKKKESKLHKELPPPEKAEPILRGWLCPACGRGNSPYSTVCPCGGDTPIPWTEPFPVGPYWRPPLRTTPYYPPVVDPPWPSGPTYACSPSDRAFLWRPS